MIWLQQNRPTAVIVGLTMAIPLFLLLWLIGDFWSTRAGYVDEIERLTPRIERLSGLAVAEERLASSSGEVKKRMLSLVYPLSADSSTLATSLQRDVRSMFSQSGMSISDSRVLPGRMENGFEYIGLNLTASGDMAALDRALESLASFTPLLVVETIDIKPDRTARRSGPPQQTATARIKLFALKESS